MFILTLIISSIFKLRFPLQSSIREVITRRYGTETLGRFRQFEQSDLRRRKIATGAKFLKACSANN